MGSVSETINLPHSQSPQAFLIIDDGHGADTATSCTEEDGLAVITGETITSRGFISLPFTS
jgi:hypothetical protein